jgi:aconitate hydratase
LKKQGLLPLTFSNPDDYERIEPDDRIDVLCADLEVGKPVLLKVHGAGGSVYDVETTHTLSRSQIEWFRDGSVMNTMGRQAEAAKRG